MSPTAPEPERRDRAGQERKYIDVRNIGCDEERSEAVTGAVLEPCLAQGGSEEGVTDGIHGLYRCLPLSAVFLDYSAATFQTDS